MHFARRFWWRSAMAAAMAALAVVGAGWAAPAAASVEGPDVLAPGPWSRQDTGERCHAVVETATADYEDIDATLTRTGEGFRVDLRSSDDFPDATFEAKVCIWSDVDRDHRISAGDEELSVRAFVGPLTWPAGGRDAAVAATSVVTERDCARVWIYAYYPDGHRSTKRSSIGCLTTVPAAAVPETSHAATLVLSAAGLLGGGVVLRRRRVQRAAAATPSNL